MLNCSQQDSFPAFLRAITEKERGAAVIKRKFILFLLAFAAAAAFLIPAAPARAITTNLRVGFNSGFGIYQSVNDRGEAEGFHIDVMNALAEDLSLAVEYVPFENDLLCYQALETGAIDLVLGTPSGSIASTAYDFIAVDALSDYSLCLIVDNSLADQSGSSGSFTGHLIAAEKGHRAKLTAQSGGPGITVFSNNLFVLADSQTAVLDSLIAGEVKLAVCEKENAFQYLHNRGVSDQYTVAINHLLHTTSSILIRGEDYTLYSRIRSALPRLRSSGAYDDLLSKWIVIEETVISQKTWQTIFIIAGIAIGAVMLYVFVSTRMRRQLSYQVEQRTIELLQINEVLSDKMGQLRRENDLRNSIVQNSASAMIIYDQNRNVSFLNRQAMRTIGTFRTEFIGQPVDSLPIFGALLNLGQSLHVASARPELIALTLDGKTRYFRCACYLLPTAETNKQFLFSVEDVTTEEREKQSLFEMEKNRVLNTIIAGIAHEIKNPLTAIKAFSTLIPTHKNNQEFMESFSRLVPKETDRINSLIESLINYARPSRGEITTINLTELAGNCIALTSSLAQKAGVKTQLRAEESYFIRANRDHIQQALINYLMNAIDAIQERPDKDVPGRSALLCVFIHQEAERLFLEVYDEGVGMDEDTLRQCMDPFYTTKAKGTGLGMAMAQQAIRENGGDVRVESVKNSFTRIIIEFERCEA